MRVVGIGESAVQEKCEEVLRGIGLEEIGYCARPGEVDVRLRGVEEKVLQAGVDKLRECLGVAVYGEGVETMEEVVVGLARAGKIKLATAESCTGDWWRAESPMWQGHRRFCWRLGDLFE